MEPCQDTVALPLKTRKEQLVSIKQVLELRLVMVNNALELFEKDKDFEEKLNIIGAIGGQ